MVGFGPKRLRLAQKNDVSGLEFQFHRAEESLLSQAAENAFD